MYLMPSAVSSQRFNGDNENEKKKGDEESEIHLVSGTSLLQIYSQFFRNHLYNESTVELP